ncbi:MAG: MBL fold metallo-hydrolase [Dehalococcoidia bacterium]|nr:MBL fold metallo-hydrolase [Dehalococcoidia bacterium]
MDISWLGHACIRVRAGGVFVVMDPVSREAGFDMGRPTADIVTISNADPAHGNVKGLRAEPLVLDGPGEYEVQGVQIVGAATKLKAPDEETPAGRNVVFVVEAEELRLAHLGALGGRLTADQKEQIGDIDVLIVPVGGERSLDPTEAARVCREFEPRVVIPMMYAPGDGGAAPAEFVRALGVEAEPPTPRVTLQKRGLGEKMRLVILEPRA